MTQTGMGVMLAALSGAGARSAAAIMACMGQEIASVELDDSGDTRVGDSGERLTLTFVNGKVLDLYDSGQSCCEYRYLRTDDDLTYHVGATLVGVEECAAAEYQSNRYDVHEIAFLVVTTSKGAITVAAHNEHNGYYGGFALTAAVRDAPGDDDDADDD